MKEIDDLMSDDLIRFVPLTKGAIAVVDMWAYDAIVAMGPWHVDGRGYARHGSGARQRLAMHREVLKLAGHDLGDLEVDHWNGDMADNRLPNLRPATPQQNQANRRSHSRESDFKGVYLHKRRNLWQARYKIGDTERSLGYFDTDEEAARAYDARMFEIWGHWAKLNFPLKLFYETSWPPVVARPLFESLAQPAGRRKRK